jgi:integrase
VNANEIDFGWHVFIDHVVASTTTRARLPDNSEAEGLAQRALETAVLFSSVLDRPTRAPAIPAPSSAPPPAGSEIPLTFAHLARFWSTRIVSHSAAGHKRQDLAVRLERYVIPHLGDKLAEGITPQEIFAVLRSIEGKGFAPLAYQIFRDMRAMYRYAVVAGIADRDPTEVLGTYVQRVRPKNNAALTDSAAIGRLLLAIRNYRGKTQSSTTRHMFRLAPILFLRPVELRSLEWIDIDLDSATIVIPGPRMKSKQPHVVPLPRQAVKILREAEEITGRGHYVFTGGRGVDRPPSVNAFIQMLRSIGYAGVVTAHGFRAMAATWLSEQGWRGRAIERQLSHVGDGNWGRQRIYNRAEFLKERRTMLQAWADHLESLERRARSIPRTKLDFYKT